MLITPDFSEAAESQQATEIKAGFYTARVKDVEQKTSQAGNEYLSWQLQIFGAEGDMANANNRVVFYRTMLSGKGAGMLKDFLKAALGEVPSKGLDTDDVLSKEVMIQVAPGMKQDGTPSGYPEVKRVRPVQA